MSKIRCSEFLNQLESWMEGNRLPDAEAHVRECRSCRSLVSDLDMIRSAAHSWEMAEPVEPPARIWTSLRLQLEAEGLIRDFALTGVQPQTNMERPANWFERVFAGLSRPALAGAYLVALIAVGLALSGPGIQRGAADHWAEVTQNATSPLSSQLDTVEHTVSSFKISDPVVTASLHENLAIVDNYIALCEKSVHEEPGNEIARDYLYGAFQQKADLLAQMTENGDGQ